MEIVIVLIWISFAAFSASIARDKGYQWINWALAGLLFGPLGFLAAIGLPDLKQRKYLRLLCEHYGVSVDSTTV